MEKTYPNKVLSLLFIQRHEDGSVVKEWRRCVLHESGHHDGRVLGVLSGSFNMKMKQGDTLEIILGGSYEILMPATWVAFRRMRRGLLWPETDDGCSLT